jgi:TPP-dependent pyruvate/acetoin dehydrogenase alpha subunit
VSRQTAAESFVARAAGYGVHGDRCDGNDVFAVYQMTKRAVDRARRGEGASLLEVATYRRKGHAEHDPQKYVPAGELEEWAARDPVDRYRARLLEDSEATAEDLDAIDKQVAVEVDEARDRADASPFPEPEGALEPVYGDRSPQRPWTRLAPPDPHQS